MQHSLSFGARFLQSVIDLAPDLARAVPAQRREHGSRAARDQNVAGSIR
jgi:hypothetical protein